MTASQHPVAALPDVPGRVRARHDGRPADLAGEYRVVARALARYLRRVRAVDRGRALASVRADVNDLFERAALEGAPIRQIVGHDAAEFASELARNYGPTHRARTARERLEGAIGRAAARGDRHTS